MSDPFGEPPEVEVSCRACKWSATITDPYTAIPDRCPECAGALDTDDHDRDDGNAYDRHYDR